MTGHWVSFGHAGGALPPLEPERQAAKSLRTSRPVLFHYTAGAAQLREMAAHVFAMVQQGVLRPVIRHRFPLAAARQAHDALEARQTTGPIVLLA